MNKIHYATSFDPKPTCERCGALIDPGRTKEPYTRTLSIWLKPPFGFYPCMENFHDHYTTGTDDSAASPPEAVDATKGPEQSG